MTMTTQALLPSRPRPQHSPLAFPLEIESVSTAPHIFFDSTDSVASQPSHMFLSYAAGSPNSMERATAILGDSHSSFQTCDLAPPPAVPKRQRATPHLFLNYAGNKSRITGIPSRTRSTGHSEASLSEGNSKSWGETPESFERSCCQFLRDQCKVSNEWVTPMSIALRTASQKRQRSYREMNQSQDPDCALFLRQALRTCSNSRGTQSLPDEQNNNDEDTNALRGKIAKQEEELLFLREALKSLVGIHTETQEEQLLVPAPVQDTPNRYSTDVPGGRTLKEESPNDVPVCIEIIPDLPSAAAVDDLTMDPLISSELMGTSVSGDEKSTRRMFNEDLSRSTMMDRKALLDNLPVAQATPILFTTPSLSLSRRTFSTTYPKFVSSQTGDFDYQQVTRAASSPQPRQGTIAAVVPTVPPPTKTISNDDDDNNRELVDGIATWVTTTMQIVKQYRAQHERLLLSGVVPSTTHETSFTEMARGEIKGSRARGLRVQVYFPSWGVALEGAYNGKVQESTGLPHGSGVLRFDNRDYYIGNFCQGALHGQGSLFLRRDCRLLTFRGRFEGNEFVGWNGPRPIPHTAN